MTRHGNLMDPPEHFVSDHVTLVGLEFQKVTY